MYTVIVNGKFQVVDLRRGRPRPEGRQFEISEKDFRTLWQIRMTNEHGLNTPAGVPAYGWDSKTSTPFKIKEGNDK